MNKAIVDSKGNAVHVIQPGEDPLALQAPSGKFPYKDGFRIKAVADVNTTQDGNTVSKIALSRQADTQAKLKEVFHDLREVRAGVWDPFYVVPQGTRVLTDGDGRFFESRAKHEAQPPLHEACEAAAKAVDAEHRKDIVVTLRDVRMADDGRLHRVAREDGRMIRGKTIDPLKPINMATLFDNPDKSPVLVQDTVLAYRGMKFETAGFNHLASFLDGGAEYLLKQSPRVRAALINRALEAIPSDDESQIKLRVRNGDGSPRLYAVVSPEYAAFDADKICRSIAAATKDMGMKGSVILDPKTTKVKVQGGWHAQHIVDLGAGDTFQAYLWAESGDARNSSFHGGLGLWDNGCRNFIILSDKRIKTFALRHTGTEKEFAAKAATAIEGLAAKAGSLLEIFAEHWGIAKKVRALDEFDVSKATRSDDPKTELMHQVFDRLDVSCKRDVAVEALLQGLDAEHGDVEIGDLTMNYIVDAVTRVHSKLPIEVTRNFEHAAGNLLMSLEA